MQSLKLKKESPKKKQRISNFFILGFALFSLGSYLFFIGFHNIDLSYNMSNVVDCIDTSPFGNTFDKFSMYLHSVKQMILGYFLLLGGCISFLFAKH